MVTSLLVPPLEKLPLTTAAIHTPISQLVTDRAPLAALNCHYFLVECLFHVCLQEGRDSSLSL